MIQKSVLRLDSACYEERFDLDLLLVCRSRYLFNQTSMQVLQFVHLLCLSIKPMLNDYSSEGTEATISTKLMDCLLQRANKILIAKVIFNSTSWDSAVWRS